MKFYPSIESVWVRNPDFRKFPPYGQLRHPAHQYISTWLLTEKVDGQNIRVCISKGNIEVNKRRISPVEQDILDTVYAVFLPVMKDLSKEFEEIIFFGEYEKKKKSFRIFDIQINNIWLNWTSLLDICGRYSLPRVRLVSVLHVPPTTHGNTIPKFHEELMLHTGYSMEGVVARPPQTILDNQGNRIMWKLCFRDLYTKSEWEEILHGAS
jgi:hypothetical protein